MDLYKNPDKMSEQELRLEVKEWRQEIRILRTLGLQPLYERIDLRYAQLEDPQNEGS